ncbi:dsDNA nuclease domain-containing protein [Exiguobacterium sp. s36]|uniref:dsDNA nuclease domain-containing protein n=1 Tax=Exiguobacterium sp. s36 TaxID=2751227 RepID=UPI001BE759E0|nr:dsDNA nuclease domain-containing protein [Exiguobacterium sp. s36]
METTQDDIRERIEFDLNEFENTLSEEEDKDEIRKHKDQIVDSLMKGNLKDLGGLIAMRGFVYQYYVAMYYMTWMIYPAKHNWWHSVILEYFDDITLLGDAEVRFIQVKTVKEDGYKTHKPNDFYKRKPMKQTTPPISHFNSWVEKNFLGYEHFLINPNIENATVLLPQFEIVTNTPRHSLDGLAKYTDNSEFKLLKITELGTTELINDDDTLKKEIIKPISINGSYHDFNAYSSKNIDYYLDKLFINKLGSTEELKRDIIHMIGEIIDIDGMRNLSISNYIVERMFQYVISNSHQDAQEKINKSDLIITNQEIKKMVDTWLVEAKEVMTVETYYDSAWGLFETALKELNNDINSQFSNYKLKQELLSELEWLNHHIADSNSKNMVYCVSILNQIFSAENSVSIWNYSESEIIVHLKEALLFIIYFLVFLEENSEVYHDARMLFHQGRSNVLDNLLFTIYHARNKQSQLRSLEKIKISLNECEVSRQITLDLYCLILGTKQDATQSSASSLLSKFKKITSSNEEIKKITDVPTHLHFLDSKGINDFFEVLNSEDMELDSFKTDDLIETWSNHLNNLVKEMERIHIES